jgi:putative ABC transport system permease protein
VFVVQPALAHTFTSAAQVPGTPEAVVLSYGLWQRRFGGDPAIVGETIQVSEGQATVVGVMPQGFQFPFAPDPPVDTWFPLRLRPDEWKDRLRHNTYASALLKRGITLPRAPGGIFWVDILPKGVDTQVICLPEKKENVWNCCRARWTC